MYDNRQMAVVLMFQCRLRSQKRRHRAINCRGSTVSSMNGLCKGDHTNLVKLRFVFLLFGTLQSGPLLGQNFLLRFFSCDRVLFDALFLPEHGQNSFAGFVHGGQGALQASLPVPRNPFAPESACHPRSHRARVYDAIESHKNVNTSAVPDLYFFHAAL